SLLTSLLHPLLLPPLSSTLFPYTTLFRSMMSSTIMTDLPSTSPMIFITSASFGLGLRLSIMPIGALRRSAIRRARTTYGRPSERSEEHTSELQSRFDLVCRLLLEKKNNIS